jgi:hypothetical protein
VPAIGESDGVCVENKIGDVVGERVGVAVVGKEGGIIEGDREGPKLGDLVGC